MIGAIFFMMLALLYRSSKRYSSLVCAGFNHLPGFTIFPWISAFDWICFGDIFMSILLSNSNAELAINFLPALVAWEYGMEVLALNIWYLFLPAHGECGLPIMRISAITFNNKILMKKWADCPRRPWMLRWALSIQEKSVDKLACCLLLGCGLGGREAPLECLGYECFSWSIAGGPGGSSVFFVCGAGP